MRYFWLAPFLFLALVFGCHKSSGNNVPVAGRITKDGQALPHAHVVFQRLDESGKPDLGTEAGGETNDEGRYTLKRVQGNVDGAPPGEYRVEIHVIERKGGKGLLELIPPQYNKQSKLKFTVPAGGTKEADFDVKTK